VTSIYRLGLQLVLKTKVLVYRCLEDNSLGLDSEKSIGIKKALRIEFQEFLLSIAIKYFDSS